MDKESSTMRMTWRDVRLYDEALHPPSLESLPRLAGTKKASVANTDGSISRGHHAKKCGQLFGIRKGSWEESCLWDEGRKECMRRMPFRGSHHDNNIFPGQRSHYWKHAVLISGYSQGPQGGQSFTAGFICFVGKSTVVIGGRKAFRRSKGSK